MVLPGVVVPPTERFAFRAPSDLHISFKSVLPGERGSLVCMYKLVSFATGPSYLKAW